LLPDECNRDALKNTGCSPVNATPPTDDRNEWNRMTSDFRTAGPAALAHALQDARAYTTALFDCFAAARMDDAANVPYLPIVNPPLWEMAHIAWFAEWYILREAASSEPGAARRPSLLARGDEWLDSNRIPHRARWPLALPSTGAVRIYCQEVLERVVDRLEGIKPDEQDDASLYPYRLALAHEDMHGEAFAYTLQTLGVKPPRGMVKSSAALSPQREIDFPGGSVELGADAGGGFVFDNERPAHRARVAAFAMGAQLVSNAQYSEFIADGGYQNPRYWTPAGRAWLMQVENSAPAHWSRDGSRWHCTSFSERIALAMDEAVRHVSLYEAQAYCMWAGRRLPSEAEWEYAAQSGHPSFHWGDLWEWTATPFEPYAGFEADAYREYSAPWFGGHQVLRGASFATPLRFRSPKFRNFYLPHRNDMFVGFRTCAL
jgi:ergothioneine biosynthesis protein EgtB